MSAPARSRCRRAAPARAGAEPPEPSGRLRGRARARHRARLLRCPHAPLRRRRRREHGRGPNWLPIVAVVVAEPALSLRVLPMGETLLGLALQHGREAYVRLLVAAGADAHVPPPGGGARDGGDTPLHLAVTAGCAPLARYLVQRHGAGVEVRDGKGERSLCRVASLRARGDKVRMLRVLVEDCGADVGAVNATGLRAVDSIVIAVLSASGILAER